MELAKQYNKMELCDFIRQYYPNHRAKDLSLATGLPISKIYRIAHKMEVKKSPEFQAELLRIESERIKRVGAKTRFKPGNVSLNKGKKMRAEVYEKAKDTMFKSGHKPHNTKPIGAEVITIDGYIKVKIANPSTWELKHRLIWQEANGPIPRGYNVQFRDGNTTNTNIDNLYLISRSQQIDQNSIVRYPNEIRKAIYRVSKLKKTIKQYETD